VERTRGGDLWRHAGRVPGFGALLIHLAGPRLWVAVMANTTPPPPLLLMALTTAEEFAPGSTFLSLPSPSDAGDARTARARELFERGATAPKADWFAPEMQALLRVAPGALPPALPVGVRLDQLEPVEDYPVEGGRMVRYRASLGDYVGHYLFGWTADDRIFWAA
jgi:hypothetical protein